MKTTFFKEELVQRLAGILPRIDIAGQNFIVDWRLKELRAENDFSKRIDLRHMAMDDKGENYLCFYHLPSKSVFVADDHLTELPKDTVMLEIPFELWLDPVGVARQYGQEDTFLLDNYPIRPELKAKVVPLEDTGLPELIKRNRGKLKTPGAPMHKKNRGKRL